MAKLLTDASADRLLRLFAALGGEPAQRARGGVRGWLPVLVVANSATAVGGSAVGNQCFDASVVLPNSQDSTQDTGADVWLTVLSGVGSVVTPTVNTVYEGVYAGLFDASGDERLRVFAVNAGGGGLTFDVDSLSSSYSFPTGSSGAIPGLSVDVPGPGKYLAFAVLPWALADTTITTEITGYIDIRDSTGAGLAGGGNWNEIIGANVVANVLSEGTTTLLVPFTASGSHFPWTISVVITMSVAATTALILGSAVFAKVGFIGMAD